MPRTPEMQSKGRRENGLAVDQTGDSRHTSAMLAAMVTIHLGQRLETTHPANGVFDNAAFASL